jgi:hypothetical protein
MCRCLIQVAEGLNGRAVYRCEHGAFRLVWDNGVFCLSPVDLAALARDIEQHLNRPTSRPGLAHGTFTELWLNGAGLRLNAMDLVSLHELLNDAAARAEAPPINLPDGALSGPACWR